MKEDDRAPLECQQPDEIKAVFHIFIKKDGSYRLNFADAVFSVDKAEGSMYEVIQKIILMYEDITKKTIDLKTMDSDFKRIRYNQKLNDKGYHTFCDNCKHEMKDYRKCPQKCKWGTSMRTGWEIKNKLTLKDLSNWKTGQNFK